MVNKLVYVIIIVIFAVIIGAITLLQSSVPSTVTSVPVANITSMGNNTVRVYGMVGIQLPGPNLTVSGFNANPTCLDYTQNVSMYICKIGQSAEDFIINSINANNTVTLHYYFIPPSISYNEQFHPVEVIANKGQVVYEECGVLVTVFDINYINSTVTLNAIRHNSVCPT